MSLEKSTVINSVSFEGKWKNLIVENLTTISEDGQVVNESFYRESFMIDEISTLPEELQPYAEGVWTDELIAEHMEWEQQSLQPIEPVEITQAQAAAIESYIKN